MNAKQMALGGVTAALAVVIMCLGGLVPLATYILPMICCILLQLILGGLGPSGCWVWYGAVSLLSLLLCPDKEAAILWTFLGYYPILKPKFQGLKAGFLLKLLLFNGAALTAYSLMIHILGMASVASQFQEMGLWLTVITLALGNVCFFLLDKVLDRFSKKRPGA